MDACWLVSHPAWCDRALCAAPAGQPTEYGLRGYHLSAPVALDIQAVRTGGMVPVGDATAQLRPEVASWPCEPYARITFGSYGDDVAARPGPRCSARMRLAAATTWCIAEAR